MLNNGLNDGDGHDKGENVLIGNDADEDDIATALTYKDTLSAPSRNASTTPEQPKSHLDQLWDNIMEFSAANNQKTADLLLCQSQPEKSNI
ncbi:hypothetical protein PCASD_24021 [Puccinia coronata f. sp. avenae]|uniref:Uncharacterized protein n=1 Tax=Puccinia coronata f. sp. avenae TaxID=200324 RepID=A0A2N5TRN9_9BASI|nr:hypothetical protein PCASD_24021 [Puccinia coronata f. sp. avenae]